MRKEGKNRDKLDAAYNHKYRTNSALDEDVCFYCGSPAECKDHVPPLSLVGSLGTSNIKAIDYVLIPACAACNGSLSDKPLLTVKSRAQVLLGKLVEEHANIVLLPTWGDEVNDLTGNIRDYVVTTQLRNKLLELRIANLETIGDRLALVGLIPTKTAITKAGTPRKRSDHVSDERRRAIEHASACRKAHLDSLIGNGMAHGKGSLAILDEYEALEEEKVTLRLNKDDGSGEARNTPSKNYHAAK